MSKDTILTPHEIAHAAFKTMLVGDTCQWPGTEWEGTGKDATLLPCGEVAVGKGLFCDPVHSKCYVADVCERHKQDVSY